jgi:hypothetical protein
MKKNKFFLILLIFSIVIISCKKDKYGSIEFCFTHTVDEKPVQFNELIYTNTAGNQYQINEIKYFISKIYLTDSKGKAIEIKQDDGIHYVDCSIEKTLRWKIEEIPERDYRSISFVFGLDENDNKSYRFVNPPESYFAWPEVLGGGYHYMQINGKFKNKDGEIQNMNIHTGIGQIYDDNHLVTEFVQNYFTVVLNCPFSVYKDNTLPLYLNMEIQRWFDTPNLYDFNEFGTGIMQNQQAQELLKANGTSVFEIKM